MGNLSISKTSLQVLGSLLTAALFIGMAYQSLAENDIGHDERDKVHDEQIQDITLLVKQNQISVTTLVATQESQISLQNERRADQKEDMSQIMALLERFLSNTNPRNL